MKSDIQHSQQIPIPDSLLYPDSFDVDDDVEEEGEDYNSFGLNLGAETPRSFVEEPRVDEDDLLDRFNNASSNSGSSGSTSDALLNVPGRSRLWRSASFYDKHKRRTKLQKEAVDRDCDICFEIAVSPARTLCCGKLYCYEHIFDWLHGPSSDGRCPSCGARCSADTGILSLKAPPKYTKSALPPKSPKLHTATDKLVPSISTSGIERRRPSRSDTVSSSSSSSSLSSSSDEDTLSPDSLSDPESPIGLHHSGLCLPKSSSGTSTPLPVPVDTAETASKVAGNILSLVGLTLVFYVLVS
ncbi:hypothetical protein Moror_2175 [Moniliophthora roreri MCA 2997]|uniref:RING-type domain-containing protein n=2 Tax=Moniliophthora roreri TaxID=221103 RepID=V2WT10_MONRO|nr:hypothetical protein Moror_2175 [Moniliophthora roreri MCA 2997]KAI3601427.1 hypothetical protein WG66_002520 [Moniliophthora roreri]